MLYGLDYLKSKCTRRAARVRIRYQYYEMKNGIIDINGVIPAEFKWLSECLGWCSKAVDVLSDRLVISKFDNDNYDATRIFEESNSDILLDNAMLSALISSCSFIYIGKKNDYPCLQVIDGSHATGIIDPQTNLLTEGYAILDTDEWGKPTLEAYFLPEKTIYYRDGVQSETMTHKAPFCALVPMIYRPDAKRPFGHSRISRACMDIQQAALRTLRRSEVASEFYSVAQKYILGLSEDAEFNGRYATMSSFLAFSKDDDGDVPTIGQFAPQSMTPYSEQMKTLASLFAGETGLTLDDLGFVTSNPSSEGSIRASHETLRLTARQAQRCFQVGFVNTAYIACCIRDNYPYNRAHYTDLKTVWAPIFEPDTSALTGLSDAILKLQQAYPDMLTEDEVKRLLGLDRI